MFTYQTPTKHVLLAVQKRALTVLTLLEVSCLLLKDVKGSGWRMLSGPVLLKAMVKC